MVLRWWDPGDLGIHGAGSFWKGFGMVVWSGDSTFRGFDSERAKGIRGRLRKHGILGDRFARSSIIKRKLQRSEGNISKDYTSTDSGCLLERGKSIADLIRSGIWKVPLGFLVAKYRRIF